MEVQRTWCLSCPTFQFPSARVFFWGTMEVFNVSSQNRVFLSLLPSRSLTFQFPVAFFKIISQIRAPQRRLKSRFKWFVRTFSRPPKSAKVARNSSAELGARLSSFTPVVYPGMRHWLDDVNDQLRTLELFADGRRWYKRQTGRSQRHPSWERQLCRCWWCTGVRGLASLGPFWVAPTDSGAS